MSVAGTVPWDRLIEPDRVHSSLYAVTTALGPDVLVEETPFIGGEDFSAYQKVKPG